MRLFLPFLVLLVPTAGCTRPQPLFDGSTDLDAGVVAEPDAPAGDDAAAIDAPAPMDAAAHDAAAIDAAVADAGRLTDAPGTDTGRPDGGRDAGPDARDAGAVDAFTCTTSEGLCQNDRDDDCDGRTDCADTDCETRPACEPLCGGVPC